MGAKKRMCGTSPSKVYPKGDRTADFLLDDGSVDSDSEPPELGLELLGGQEDDPGHP